MDFFKNYPLYRILFYVISSTFFLFSCDLVEDTNNGSPALQISDFKKIVEAGEIPAKSDLGTYSQALQDTLTPVAGDTAKTLNVLYVSTNGGSDDTKDGSTWQKAFATAELQIAIDVASAAASSTNPYLIVVAPGTYALSTTLNMKNNVVIIGGLATDWSISSAKTIFDGGGRIQIFNNSGLDKSAVLYGVTITKGSNAFGGGMFNSNSSPSLIQVTFSDNKSSDTILYAGGGGMYNFSSSSPSLIRVTFSNNTAAKSGGAIYDRTEEYSNPSSPSLREVIFTGNTAVSGGGMYIRNSSPSLTQVSFSGNRAIKGGGIYNYKSSPTLTQVTFSGNTAVQSGGGIYNRKSSPTLTQVTFSANSATDGGGGIYNLESSPILKQISLSGNKAIQGGGVYNTESSPTLAQLTLSGNTATDGGGVYNHKSSPTLTQATFFGNSATNGSGGGIYNTESSPTLIQATLSSNTATAFGSDMFSGNSSSPTVMNSIFRGNPQNSSSGPIYIKDGSLQIYYSLVKGFTSKESFYSNSGESTTITQFGVVPTTKLKLATFLADNGGFVQTLLLENGSSAINAGIYIQKSGTNYYYSEDATTWYRTLDNSGLSTVATLPAGASDLTANDARGYAITGTPDIGAYEYGAQAP